MFLKIVKSRFEAAYEKMTIYYSKTSTTTRYSIVFILIFNDDIFIYRKYVTRRIHDTHIYVTRDAVGGLFQVDSPEYLIKTAFLYTHVCNMF